MPRYQGLRLTLPGTSTATSIVKNKYTSSNSSTSSPGGRTVLKSRGGSRDRDADNDHQDSTEEHKRLRGAPPTAILTSPSPAHEKQQQQHKIERTVRGARRYVVDDPVDASSEEATVSSNVVVGAGESIYSLASPWVPTREAVKQKRTCTLSRERARDGGGRTLCFDGEEVEDEQDYAEEQKRFFSGLRLQQRSSSNVSTESEPVDIPIAAGNTVGAGRRALPQARRELIVHPREEGWVSLWDTYTRILPGTYSGCSPPKPNSKPPPDSPLYVTPRAFSGSNNNNGDSTSDVNARAQKTGEPETTPSTLLLPPRAVACSAVHGDRYGGPPPSPASLAHATRNTAGDHSMVGCAGAEAGRADGCAAGDGRVGARRERLWGQSSRLPPKEAQMTLQTISADVSGPSPGSFFPARDEHGVMYDAEEDEMDDGDDSSLTDLDSSGGLMFDLEM